MSKICDTDAWHNGYNAKIEEIKEMGWIASRDKFNTENPPAQKWTGSSDGLCYSIGEFAALEKMRVPCGF